MCVCDFFCKKIDLIIKKAATRESKFLTWDLLVVDKFYFEAQGYNHSFRNPRIPVLEGEQSLKYFRVMDLIGTHSEELPYITDSKEKDVEARVTNVYMCPQDEGEAEFDLYFATKVCSFLRKHPRSCKHLKLMKKERKKE